jgi:hypothetical protein
MKIHSSKTTIVIGLVGFIFLANQLVQCTDSSIGQNQIKEEGKEDEIAANANKMLEEGRQTFRFETFGDEAYWTDALQLNKAIAG